jgi:hypothetical protein
VHLDVEQAPLCWQDGRTCFVGRLAPPTKYSGTHEGFDLYFC